MSLETPDEANRSIGVLDVGLTKISKLRADLGAYQNRLEHVIRGLDIGAENLQAAESRIRDVDMASEMVEYTKNQILNQAGTAMLAQANQRAQTVLSLLQ
jgi:flagellin